MSYFPPTVDNTMRSAFVRCEREAMHAHIDGLTTTEPHWDLHAGIAFAAGMEAARKAHYIHGQPYRECLEAGKAAVAEAWGSYVPPKSNYKFKTKDRMIGAIPYYFSVWPFEDDEPFILDGAEPLIEFNAVFPLPVLHPNSLEPLKFSIRLDFVARQQGTGQGVIIDEKTTGKIDENLICKYDLDSQVLGYCFYAGELTHAQMQAEVRVVKIGKNAYEKAPILVTPQPWLLKQWYKNMCQDFQHMVDAYRSSTWRMNFGDACNPYGRSCDFKPLCLSASPQTLTHNYVVRFWHPETRSKE